MARRDDFNEQAMEEKIKKNLARGFTIKTFLEELLNEQKGCFENMRISEMRIVELQDQIDYVKEKYVKPDDIHGRTKE